MSSVQKEWGEEGQPLGLTLTDGASVVGVSGLFFNGRVKPKDGFKVASIRHTDDDDSIPATLEKFVRVNRFGDFAYKGDDLFIDKDYLEILDWDLC